MPSDHSVWGLFSWWRYRTRTAAEATAACGGNREPRLGPRSDFSKPCQGAAEKSANATRTGASRQIPSRFPTARNVYRDDCRFVVAVQDENRNKQRRGILPFAILNKAWYTRLSSITRNLSGRGPSILLCKTVRSLKSPTGAFIVPLRCTNANL